MHVEVVAMGSRKLLNVSTCEKYVEGCMFDGSFMSNFKDLSQFFVNLTGI